jgi:hypothetical protein
MPFIKLATPWTVTDLVRFAYECDVAVDTVRKVFQGHTPNGKASQRVYRAIVKAGCVDWIQKLPVTA